MNNKNEKLLLIYFKYFADTKFSKIIENQIKNKKDYIYNKLEEKIINVLEFNNNSSQYIFICEVKNDVVNKIWLGKCRLYKNDKLIIENAYEVNEHIAKIVSLYEKYNETSIIENPSFVSHIEVENKEFYNLLINVNENYEEKQKNEIYTEKIIEKHEYDYPVESRLHPLAQKSKKAIRAYNITPEEHRTEFQRDINRITYSKSFRRLVDKAQIYTSSKGDHYRTRLTHTMELAQISKGIARALNLNEDLTEAIALAHDLGHTPFGHEGERELNEILHGNIIKLSDNTEIINYGGFKHNYQGLRIVTYLEEKYLDYSGLNLTYQTMEGILKHTKTKKCKKCTNCNEKCYDIDKFFFYPNKELLYLDIPYPTTLEGQIIMCTDEIAQRAHDLDDGISSNAISLEEFLNDLKEDTEMKDLYHYLISAINKKFNRDYVNIEDLNRVIIVSSVTKYFIEDLINTSQFNINNNDNYISDNGHIEKHLIKLSEKSQNILDKFEKLITSKVINSQEVNSFDGKSAYIIRKLFKAYYSNPRQLPDSTIRKIEIDIKSFSPTYINIRKGAKQQVAEEIKIYQGLSSEIQNPQNIRKHEIFMRNVADLIAGMTDGYANKQFQKLYIP